MVSAPPGRVKWPAAEVEHVEYSNLGNTGIRVSQVILGCGNFGGIGSAPEFYGKGETEEEAFALMDRAFELGINVFDTADAYGGGRSETMIGRWLTARGGSVRDQVLVSTKVFNPVGEGPNDWGLSRRHIRRQIEASLARLGVETIDLYLVHEPDPATPMEETLSVLDDSVHSGKIHYVGVSNMPAHLIGKSLETAESAGFEPFRWVQNPYSLLERRDESDVLPLCEEEHLGYTPFSPLAGGLLTGKYELDRDYPKGSRMATRPEPYVGHWNEVTFDRLRRLGTLAEGLDVSSAGLALAWVMSHPQVTAPIVGPRRPAHFDAVEEALALELTSAQRKELSELFDRSDGHNAT
jgi:aryl-alcohol dehydrogenase-like predicted oxidoreductase